MAEIHGSAGLTTCFKGDQLMSQAIIPMLSMGLLTYFLFRSGSSLTQPVRVSVVCLAALLGYRCIHDVFLLEAAAGQYYGGAVGERDVGRVLSRLPFGFHVFNGIRFPSGDVDHVVVGPTGVFSIETKNYSGTIGVREDHLIRNGELLAHDPIRQSRLEARYVSSLTGRPGRCRLCLSWSLRAPRSGCTAQSEEWWSWVPRACWTRFCRQNLTLPRSLSTSWRTSWRSRSAHGP